MESFNQRISTRCYLEALNRSETQDYIHAQIDLAGGCGMDLFGEDTCQSVYKATDGVPRLINQLCDHALLVAYVAGCRIIEPAQIEEAWADLQQLPTPWNGDNQREQGGVIEFGGIDDLPDETPLHTVVKDLGFPSLRVANDFDDVEADLSEVCNQIERIEGTSTEEEEDFQPVGSIKPEIELVFTDTDHPFKEEFEHEEVITDRYAALAAAPSSLLQPPAAESTAAMSAISKIKAGLDRPELEETLPLSDQSLTAEEESAEKPIPVVENDAGIPQNQPRPIAAVRRQEYSRLFAKLLQGTSP